MKYQVTDAGRSEHLPKEKNDCTVRAYAIFFGVNYWYAHEQMTALGRKPKKGFHWKQNAVKCMGFELLPEYSCICLERVMKVLPTTGRFILRTHNHVFPVIDGVIHDLHVTNPKTIVKMTYQKKGS